MSRQEIQNSIDIKSDKTKLIPNNKGRSNVWQTFDLIEFNNKIVDFVCCRECKNVIAYASRYGTGTLTRHRCVLAANENANQPRIDSLPLFAKKTVPNRVMKILERKQLALVAKDLHSFSVTEG